MSTIVNTKSYYHATGGDKEAMARVFMFPGTGKIVIKNRMLDNYFPGKFSRYRMEVMKPLNLTNMENNFDLKVTVAGGGNSGQADAIKLAIAKALIKFNIDFKSTLKEAGCLTRDKRKVERKKYGLRKARKKEQYSKR